MQIQIGKQVNVVNVEKRAELFKSHRFSAKVVLDRLPYEIEQLNFQINMECKRIPSSISMAGEISARFSELYLNIFRINIFDYTRGRPQN